MGWNSYDAFGDSVTESEVHANAQYMKDHLASHGWKYVVVDFRWYDPKPTGDDSRLYKDRLNATLSMDEFGRLVPAPNRFPSAADGKGFKPLADRDSCDGTEVWDSRHARHSANGRKSERDHRGEHGKGVGREQLQLV